MQARAVYGMHIDIRTSLAKFKFPFRFASRIENELTVYYILKNEDQEKWESGDCQSNLLD